ncbi:MAG TPA: RNB domain-containing ribonuclease, partial [Polyangiaceae bacterium]|nr:RNB domain-containing ribonuclease [Polyangiaceae bacterium]
TRRAKDPGIQGAYQMVEELMLLANERVARWLTSKRSPAVYRVHAPPDPERLEQLGVVAKKLGVPFEADTLDSALGVGRWLKRLAKHPLQPVLEGLLLRSLKMAQYDTNNIGHFGLASDCYVHFTSPIRRYPDLLVHRLCKGLLRGGKPRNSPDELAALSAQAARSSETERAVMQAEREVVDVYRCLLMQDRVGQVYEARVTGMAGSGVYAVLDEPFVDVLIRFESLGPDRYVPSDDGLSVSGQRSGDRISLGDRLTLVIEDVALLRRTVFGRRVPPSRVIATAEELAESPLVEATPQLPRRRDLRQRGRPSEPPPAAGARRARRPAEEDAARPPFRAGKRSGSRRPQGKTRGSRFEESAELGGGRTRRPARARRR